jgi:hypothetical protein
MQQRMSIRIYSKKSILRVICLAVNTKTQNRQRVNFYLVFLRQSELMGPNPLPRILSPVSITPLFLRPLRSVTLSINSAGIHNTSPPPINRTRPHICSLTVRSPWKPQFYYSLNTKFATPWSTCLLWSSKIKKYLRFMEHAGLLQVISSWTLPALFNKGTKLIYQINTHS